MRLKKRFLQEKMKDSMVQGVALAKLYDFDQAAPKPVMRIL
jgi:hypothetical protein